MRTHKPEIITESNLSIAWTRAFLHVLRGHDDGCLVVALRGFEKDLPAEDTEISKALSEFLRSREPALPTINQTAMTIVPYERWVRMNKPELQTIKRWYLDKPLPRLKARCTKNRHGTYFERLVRYSGARSIDGEAQIKEIDQLAHVLEIWRKTEQSGKRPRQSALQLACFDPAKDHTGAALAGFPCLQQVSLSYRERGALEINAYYPTQYMVERAYGNYLGLCQLGHFIAHQLNVRLVAFTCFIGNPQLGDVTKSEVAGLARALENRLQELACPVPAGCANIFDTEWMG